jgi:microcystin-dependent protein
MSNYEATRYDYSGANITGLVGVSTGTVIPWSDTSVPSGYLECNGSTTFNVPDLKNDNIVGRSNSKALASTAGANAVQATGNVGGSTAAHTLTTPEFPSHTHGPVKGPPAASQYGGAARPPCCFNPASSGNTGGGTGHSHNMSATFTGDTTSVLQPYLTMLYVIKT